MTWPIRGVLEGFYGRPWTWDERHEVARWCGARGLTHYVWAPKDDPLHRRGWRTPWSAEHLDGFAGLVAAGDLSLGVALGPGLSMDASATADHEALWSKVAPVVDLGATLVVLALDDIPNRPGLGGEHADTTARLHARLGGAATLVLVPTEYVGAHPTTYLRALADGVPPDVPIGWTGDAVVNDSITAAEAAARAGALGGRPPLLWDNHPVNDAILADRLFLGPLAGRDPALAERCSGYLANALVQPLAGRLPLSATAAWLAGTDPGAAWAVDAEAMGLEVLAEACDGSVPRSLVEAVGAARTTAAREGSEAALGRWLEAAAAVTAPDGLADEVGPWVDQVVAEARLGLRALRLLAAARAATVDQAAGDALVGAAFTIMARWPQVRRSPVSVLGPRLGFRPAMGQRADGAWQLRPDALEEDRNALDLLVRLALAAAWA